MLYVCLQSLHSQFWRNCATIVYHTNDYAIKNTIMIVSGTVLINNYYLYTHPDNIIIRSSWQYIRNWRKVSIIMVETLENSSKTLKETHAWKLIQKIRTKLEKTHPKIWMKPKKTHPKKWRKQNFQKLFFFNRKTRKNVPKNPNFFDDFPRFFYKNSQKLAKTSTFFVRFP